MLGAGLLLFVLSFFLRAVVGAGVGGGPLLGYQCAGLALLLPWTDIVVVKGANAITVCGVFRLMAGKTAGASRLNPGPL